MTQLKDHRLRQYRLPIFLLGIVTFIVLPVLVFYPLNPNKIHLPLVLETPSVTWSLSTLFGYDELGRSVFDRLLWSLLPALMIAILVVTTSLTIGVTIGLLSAYCQRWIDSIIVRLIDVFLAFPGLLLAIILAALLGPGLFNVVIALSVVGWVGFARITRAQVLSLKHQDFVHAAIAQGVKTRRILWRHLLPIVMIPILVEVSFAFAGSVLAEAGLSFLGLGVQPPNPSWGQMIRTGSQYMLVAPHLVIAPGVALWLSVLLINYFGESLQKRLLTKHSSIQ